MDGFVIGPKENKLGIRGSDTHSLMLLMLKYLKKIGWRRWFWIFICNENIV